MAQGKANTPYISQRLFPTWEQVDALAAWVEALDSPLIKEILEVTLCSGFRIGESLNSYIYKDRDDIIVRAVVEKKRKPTGQKDEKGHSISEPLHRMFKRGFLGEDYLNSILHDNVWKSVRMMNVYGLKRGWMLDRMSRGIYEPEFLFPGTVYDTLYRHLKQLGEMECFYFHSQNQLEEPVRVMATPGFHFYRKAFVAKAASHFDNIIALKNYMKWSDFEELQFYYRLYKEKDAQGALSSLDAAMHEGWHG